MVIPFLEAVAKAYASREIDLSGHLFIFPSRRAATFFQKNMVGQLQGRIAMLPRVMTMAVFVENVSGRVVPSRIELIFILYKAYSNLLSNSGLEKVPDFDAFRRWGETALSDFNEVDMQDVDPDAIFKNVKDLKEISSNFLSEEQLKVMEEFFGQAYNPETVATEFWKKFNENEDNALHSKFRLLWQIMAPLYHSFAEELESRSLISPGRAYRMAADILETNVPSCVTSDKIVIVGFNALTHSEQRIFDALSSYTVDDGSESFVDFFWDIAGPVINDKTSAAGRYVLYNRDRWQSPLWAIPYISEADVDEMPESLKVIAVPSNTMQAKVAGNIIEDMTKRIGGNDLDDAKVAIVLPDESLLIPMLYSLPDNVKDVNVTMGYPLKLSGVSTFVSLLRRLQAGRRKTGNRTGYYYKDLESVLSHPFSHMLFGSAVTKVKEWIRKHHHAVVDINEVSHISSELNRLLAPLPDDSGPDEVVAWLDRLLQSVTDASYDSNHILFKAKVDVANIEYYRLVLKQMLEVVKEYEIDMQWRTFLSLTDRLISAETVPLEGQPLKGLQVMGMLETRALDFDRVIIPSLNERILPSRRRVRTFISDSLRKAYGLPPVTYSESIFAYYFFRMIARAKEVVLLYDARSSDGARSGDISRYVLQLQYLYAKDSLKLESRTFDISKSDLKPSPIPKTEEIMKMLSSFTETGPDGRNLSATALSRFADCEIRFYFENVLGIKTDEEAVGYIDAITQGSILHYVMENIYLPEAKQGCYLAEPELIEPSMIMSKMSDIKEIDRLIRIGINKLYFHRKADKLDTPLRGSVAFVAKVFRSQILAILDFDLKQAPFKLYGVEIDGNVSLKMPVGKPVNMRFAIDRLDKVCIPGEKAENERLRIVDYKTGSVHVQTESMQSVFEGDLKGRNLLQLWLYANLFDALPDKNLENDDPRPLLDLFNDDSVNANHPILLEIYDVNYMKSGKHTYPKIDKEECKDYSEYNEEFLQQLEVMLLRLFNPEEPFMNAHDPNSCNYCPFKTICWR